MPTIDWDSSAHQVVAETIENAKRYGPVDEETEPPVTSDSHPLSLMKSIEFVETPMAVNFVVDGFIQEGLVFIAGQQGVGKTSALLPLAMAQAGLHERGYPFGPKKSNRWRHVIYITEDTAQVNRIIAAMVSRGDFTFARVKERIHVIPAVAMDAALFVQVREEYASLTANDSGVPLSPLVVVDTRSACFVMESENDNAQMSKMVAHLKQNFAGLPIWVVAHLSKETANRSNAANLSVRGAGAAEGDAHQVLFLVKEEKDHSRWLVRGKTRFESPWPELYLRSEVETVPAQDRWHDTVHMNVRWSVAEVPEQSRAVLAERADAEKAKKALADLRTRILDAVQVARSSGHPLNRAGVKGKVAGKGTTVTETIQALLAESWLVEIEVPAAQRINPNKKSFLVRLSTEQHDAYLACGVLPAELQDIPQSYRKPPIPSVPAESPDASEAGVT